MSRGHRQGHHEPMEETLALLALNAVTDAMGNYAAIDDGAPANTSAGPATYVIAAIVLTPRTSGVFRIDVHLSGVDSSSEEVTLNLLGAKENVAGTPIVMVGGTAAAQLGNAAGPATTSNGGETATAAGTEMSFTGNSAGVGLSSKHVTAVATDPFNIGTSGIFSLSAAPATKTPWPLGQTALVYVALTAAAGTLSALTLDFTVQEQPSA